MNTKRQQKRPLISVLMSVYNESREDVLKSVQSILEQTYGNFEFIIVCDNPDSISIRKLLREVEKMDDRIKIVWNKDNIGLALSLNRAYEISKGSIIARMDADDISRNNRFEKQVEFLIREKCDLIWSSYSFIDEDGGEIEGSVRYYTKDEIIRNLPYKNIVHHPTVMLTRDMFEKVGGYRNFPCSQDYDLWLRMLDAGAKIEMLNEVLLQYRVRRDSVSCRKRYQQLCTLNYIRRLYRERKKGGFDSYSVENYNNYIKKCGVGDKRCEESFRNTTKGIKDGKMNVKNGKIITGFIMIVYSVIKSKYYRQQIKLFICQKVRGI